MRSDFSVHVNYRGSPLPGVFVKIRAFSGADENGNLFSATTDQEGAIYVENLSPGVYWLDAQLLGISAAYECFHVGSSPSPKAKNEVSYEWGDSATRVRQAAGRLIDNQQGQGGSPIWNLLHPIDVPVTNATLKLQDPFNGAEYDVLSDSDGRFSFSGMRNGIYVLHIDAGTEPGNREYDSTDLLIELSPTAKRDMLLLSRQGGGAGSCGDTSFEVRNSSQ